MGARPRLLVDSFEGILVSYYSQSETTPALKARGRDDDLPSSQLAEFVPTSRARDAFLRGSGSLLRGARRLAIMVSAVDSGHAVNSISLVIVCSDSRVCGFPLGHVIETMRPLPLTRLPESPAFVRGVAIIRGRSTPVVDLGLLLGGRESDGLGRFLTLRVDSGHLALAVDEVVGIRGFPASVLHPLPALLGGLGDGVVERLAVLDSKLLMVLRSSRILPARVWRQVTPEAAH